ncbi:MAG: putative sugar nucleotidyl transferase, partial [Rhodohalobacter sp.]|uniref:putative sugar nucleotidyl transferase n=1 Tax=Rhodohalobacter sp. TaxID=1974210 RepID=UPI003975C476
MKLQYSLFEDHYMENFHPLTLTRPVYDLRVGIFTLAEKWKYALGLPVDSALRGPIRQHLSGVFELPEIKKEHDAVLWINPRFIPNVQLIEQIKQLEISQGLTCNDSLIAALISTKEHSKWEKSGIDQKALETSELKPDGNTIVKNIWELFQLNGNEIRKDLILSKKIAYGEEKIYPNTLFVKPENIYIDEGALIEPGAMLIAALISTKEHSKWEKSGI